MRDCGLWLWCGRGDHSSVMLRAVGLVHNTCRHLNIGYSAALKLGILIIRSEWCADCEWNKEACSFIIIIIIIIIYLVFQRSTRVGIELVNRLQYSWYTMNLDNKTHIIMICEIIHK